MVSISMEDGNFVFEVKGMHKLWAFKNQITIPPSHIVSVYHDPETLRGWPGWRLPGTSIPGIITAGTYINHGDMIFWDVCNMDNCIIIELEDEHYKKLVIEVENVAEAIRQLRG